MAPFVTALHLFLTDKTVTHRDTIIRSFVGIVVEILFCILYILFSRYLVPAVFEFEKCSVERRHGVRANQKCSNVSLYKFVYNKHMRRSFNFQNFNFFCKNRIDEFVQATYSRRIKVMHMVKISKDIRHESF